MIYDALLEKTLNIMKTNTGFFNIEKRHNGDIIWNGFPLYKMGGSKPNINEETYSITPGIQKVLTDTSRLPLKKIQ